MYFQLYDKKLDPVFLVFIVLSLNKQIICMCFSFEPEVFPALVYRMVKPRAVFLMFVNGKVVLTGNLFV